MIGRSAQNLKTCWRPLYTSYTHSLRSTQTSQFDSCRAHVFFLCALAHHSKCSRVFPSVALHVRLQLFAETEFRRAEHFGITHTFGSRVRTGCQGAFLCCSLHHCCAPAMGGMDQFGLRNEQSGPGKIVRMRLCAHVNSPNIETSGARG